MEIKIRPARVGDEVSILHIHSQAVEDRNAFIQEPDEFRGTVDGKKQQIERVANSKSSCLLVAELEQQVVGWVSLSGYDFKKLNHVAMLGMAVDREFRQKGIGFVLVKSAVEWAKSSSTLRRIALAVFETNSAAVAIYKKSGFEIEGIEKNEIRLPNGNYVNQIIMGLIW